MPAQPIAGKIMHTIVNPGGVIPIGYRCEADGTEVMRNPGETDKELSKRCIEAIVWPTYTDTHNFWPIYEPGQIFPSMA
jgi:hypothetical protein